MRKLTRQYEQIYERYTAAIEDILELKEKEENIDIGKEHNFTELLTISKKKGGNKNASQNKSY